ncbi:hypothetical protein MMC07_006421 [Pseudocyphellaria aurata]|nr:hypothetical protein [Pseudocyphellaria aurata]
MSSLSITDCGTKYFMTGIERCVTRSGRVSITFVQSHGVSPPPWPTSPTHATNHRRTAHASTLATPVGHVSKVKVRFNQVSAPSWMRWPRMINHHAINSYRLVEGIVSGIAIRIALLVVSGLEILRFTLAAASQTTHAGLAVRPRREGWGHLGAGTPGGRGALLELGKLARLTTLERNVEGAREHMNDGGSEQSSICEGTSRTETLVKNRESEGTDDKSGKQLLQAGRYGKRWSDGRPWLGSQWEANGKPMGSQWHARGKSLVSIITLIRRCDGFSLFSLNSARLDLLDEAG